MPMLRRLCARLAHPLVTPSALCVYRNASLAVCLATWSVQLAALLGTTLPVHCALLAALILGIGAGSFPITALRRLSLLGLTPGTLLAFCLTAWMVAAPWSLQLVDGIMTRPGYISLESPAWNGFALFALLAIAMGVPAFITAQAACDPDDACAGRAKRLPFVFLGAVAGLVLWAGGLGQIMGPYYCG